jgi:hypothetical protein
MPTQAMATQADCECGVQATVDALARQVYDLEQALAERERLVKG